VDNSTAAALIDDFHALIPGLPHAPRDEVFRRLRHELPVFRSEKIGVWVAARYQDVIAVTTQDELFQPPQAGLGSPAYGRTFLRMNGREHSKKIGIVGREMRSARALRERLDGIVLRMPVNAPRRCRSASRSTCASSTPHGSRSTPSPS
jgi:hypothetical protein